MQLRQQYAVVCLEDQMPHQHAQVRCLNSGEAVWNHELEPLAVSRQLALCSSEGEAVLIPHAMHPTPIQHSCELHQTMHGLYWTLPRQVILPCTLHACSLHQLSPRQPHPAPHHVRSHALHLGMHRAEPHAPHRQSMVSPLLGTTDQLHSLSVLLWSNG